MKRETKEGEEKVSDDEPGHLNNNVFSLFNRLLGGHEISNTKDTTERTRRRNDATCTDSYLYHIILLQGSSIFSSFISYLKHPLNPLK